MKTVPANPDGMNDERAQRAADALESYSDDDSALCDLLCDLMHWCDRHEQTFSVEWERALRHYECETDPEEVSV